MAAYVIADLEVTDPAGFEEYRKLASASIAKFGGKFLVRGGAVERVEGNWAPKRMVVLEFESMERAKRWYTSQDYTKAKGIRLKTALTNLVFVEGV